MKNDRVGLTVFVSMLLAALVFSACGQKEQPRQVQREGARTDGWFEGRDFSEHIEIEYAEIRLDGSRNYTSGDEWVKQWAGNFNITYNIVPMPEENWGERIRVWVNSGDAPETFTFNYNHGEATNYAEQGMVKKLPDGWEKKYPNLARANGNSPMSAMADKLFGGTYFLFRPMFSNNRPARKLSNHQSLYIRKDWAKMAGVDVGNGLKLSEIYNLARKIKAANPGKVSNFAPIVVRPSNLAFFVQWNNTHAGVDGLPYYRGDDGKYRWGPADTSTLEALKLLTAAYREGLIDPEFYTIKSPDDWGAFYSTGRSAMVVAEAMSGRMTTWAKHFDADLKLNAQDVMEVTTVLGEDGYFHGYPHKNFWGVRAFSPDISDKKLDRILQMLDYSCTTEAQYRLRLGIEGVDWKYDENNNLVSLLPPNVLLADKYAILGNMYILTDDFQFSNPTSYEPYRNRARELYEVREALSTDKTLPVEPDWTVELHSSQALNLATMNYADEYCALILKTGDIETNWRNWVKDKMPLIQPVLDELNAK